MAKQEALKAQQREAKRERQLTGTQNYKEMAKNGQIFDRTLPETYGQAGASGAVKEKKELTPEERRKKAAAKAAAAASGAANTKKKDAPKEQKGADPDPATDVADATPEVEQPEATPAPDAGADAMDVSDPTPVKSIAQEVVIPEREELSEEAKAERRAVVAAEAKLEAERQEADVEAAAKAALSAEAAESATLVTAAIGKGGVKALTVAEFGVLAKAAYE